MSNSAVFFVPGAFLPPGFLPSFFTFVAADPRARGLAERRETSQPCTCRASDARRHACEAWALPRNREARLRALCGGVVGPGSRLVPGDWPVGGLTRRRRLPLALLPGCGAGLFVSAVTMRGRRYIPLRLQDRFRTTPLMSGMLGI